MRPPALTAKDYQLHRQRLRDLLPPRSLAVLNANDVLPTNADGTLPLQPNSDLRYLAGITQEESILVLAPDALDEKQREILFLREPNPRLATWEGHKLSREEASAGSGVQQVKWLPDFPVEFHKLMCEVDHVYLNSNEHPRAALDVETRDARFVRDCQRRYPLHDYRRLAPLLHRLRLVKSAAEIRLLRHACEVTAQAFQRVLRLVKPGITEAQVEAEFARQFTRQRCGFAYPPIIAGGRNSCVLHYQANDQVCRKGQVLLLDVAAEYRGYNSDLTRTIPVGGRFTPRQRQVYQAVRRIQSAMIRAAVPGKLHRDWQKEAERLTENELVNLGLLSRREIRRQDPDQPALKKYFMHGIGHPIGLDVHDVGSMREPMAPGWVLTVEPGIYIPEEALGIRLENIVVLTEQGPIDLMGGVPIEAKDIEDRMGGR